MVYLCIYIYIRGWIMGCREFEASDKIYACTQLSIKWWSMTTQSLRPVVSSYNLVNRIDEILHIISHGYGRDYANQTSSVASHRILIEYFQPTYFVHLHLLVCFHQYCEFFSQILIIHNY